MKRVLVFSLLLQSCFAYAIPWSQRGLNESKVLQWLEKYQPAEDSYQPSVGVELEGRYKNKQDHQFSILAYSLLEHFNSVGLKQAHVTFPNEIARVIVQQNSTILAWEIKEEHTILGLPGHVNFEMTSPILRSEEELEMFWQSIEVLNQKVHFVSAPTSAGVHLHLGFENPQAEEVALFTLLFESALPELIKIFSVDPIRLDDYAASLTPLELNGVFKFLFSEGLNLNDNLGSNNMIRSRNKAINWRSYQLHKTVEIRLFNSTFNVEVLRTICDFLVKLHRAVRTKAPTLIRLISTTSLEQLDFYNIAEAVGAKITDQKLQSKIHFITSKETEEEVRRLRPSKKYEINVDAIRCENVLL